MVILLLDSCTMQHFGMSSPGETDVIPPGLPSDQKQAWFSDEMLKIVDKFVLQWKELEHTAGVFGGGNWVRKTFCIAT